MLTIFEPVEHFLKSDVFLAFAGLAALMALDLTTMPFSADQIESMFGDGSVILPDGIDRPTHWPSADLDWREFYAEWALYKADPDGYIRPEDRTENAPD